MRLDINLASRPYQDASGFWMRWGIGLAAAILVTLGVVTYTVSSWLEASRERQAIEKIEDNIAALNNQESQARAFLNQPNHRQIKDRSQFLNELFHRKAFSWTKVFEDLEQVMPPHLHVVSIHPELTAGNQLQIRLVVAGESHDRALALVTKMEDSQRFHDTKINEEKAASSQGFREVQFDISALYVPSVEIPAMSGGGN